MQLQKMFSFRDTSLFSTFPSAPLFDGGTERVNFGWTKVAFIRKDFSQLIEGNGYEARQSSLLQVFVRFFGFDRAENTIVVYSVLRI